MQKQIVPDILQWLLVSPFFLLILIFLLSPVIPHCEEEEQSPSISPADMVVPVKTVFVKRGELPVQIKAAGVFIARSQTPAMVVSKIAGIVSSIEVQDGQRVEERDVLLRLDARLAKIALTKAKAGLRSAESDLQKAKNGGLDIEQADLDAAAKEAETALLLAKQEFSRQTELFKNHLASEKAAEDARIAMENAERKAKVAAGKASNFRSIGREAELIRLQSTVELAKAEVDSADYILDSIVIKSPCAGRVSGLKVNTGGVVDDKTTLAQIIGDRTGILRLGIAPAIVDEVTIDSLVSVLRPAAKEPAEGKVVSIGGELDPDTGMVPIEVQIETNPQFQPRIGEILYADITTIEKVRGFLVPNPAMTIEDDKAEVFAVDEKKIAHAVPVEILTRTAELSVVASEEISDGSTIITDGNYNLPDGAHVVEDATK